MADSFEMEIKGEKAGWLNVVIVAGLIFGVYRSVIIFHGVHYDFGVPAMLLITLQIMLWKVNYSYISSLKKVPMMATFILAFQMLDVMPALRQLPFGRGETSNFIKSAAELLGCTRLLNSMCAILFLIFLFVGVLLFLILRDENHLWQIHELQEQNERIRMEALIRERDSRAARELQHLVHDLKSPLTAIQALAGALQYKCGAPEQAMEREYLQRIEMSVERMSDMISQILYEDRKLPVKTQAILDIVLAQISPAEYAGAVHTDNRIPDILVRVNSLRFARAIINLIENAYHARGDERFRVCVGMELLEEDGKERVQITVSDNGKGISHEELSHVWERGFSKRGSSGLGLSFTRDVVEQSGGRIRIESEVDRGTQVIITLPRGEMEHE